MENWTWWWPTASVLLNKGDGTFLPEVGYGVAGKLQAVAAGDFNGDGKADIAVAGAPGILTILAGNGDGSSQFRVTHQIGSDPQSMVVGDFGGHGVTELAVATPGGVQVVNANGSFVVTTYAGGQGPSFVAVGDFNGDGVQDLAVTNTNNEITCRAIAAAPFSSR
jgi:hypothetical protein